MGKIWDFLLTDSWNEYQQVQVLKKLGKALESLSPNQLNKIKKILEEEE